MQVRTSHKGGRHPLAGLESSARVRVRGNLHPQPATGNGGEPAHKERNGGEQSVVNCGVAPILLDLQREAVLAGQQHEDEDREARLVQTYLCVSACCAESNHRHPAAKA